MDIQASSYDIHESIWGPPIQTQSYRFLFVFLSMRVYVCRLSFPQPRAFKFDSMVILLNERSVRLISNDFFKVEGAFMMTKNRL